MDPVHAVHATATSFSAFGKIVSRPTGLPTSQAADYKFWSDIADYEIHGETEIGICTVYAQPQQRITGLERHLRTPEILIPIDAPFILPLYGEDGRVEAFRVDIGEVVVVNTGVWHGACLPVEAPAASYFVIFRKNTPHEDVEKKTISPVDIL